MYRRASAFLLVFALLVAACGDDGDESSTDTLDPGSTTTTRPPCPGELVEMEMLAPASQQWRIRPVLQAYIAVEPCVVITASYDSVGDLHERIDEGERPDLYLSTENTINQVSTDRVRGEPVDFGSNMLQIIVEKGNPKAVASLEAFGPDPSVVSALCDPDTSCGSASANLLEDAGIDTEIDTFGEGATQVIDLVADGQADAALVWRTMATTRATRISTVAIDPAINSSRTDYVLIRFDDGPEAAAFLDWIATSADANEILIEKGLR